ncbi:MAG TPA: adenosylcobinamide-GDP ribazoletransferase [Candidatus Binatia bacterium]|nr:adenosylcobinamide-GDP ribazoletransferase [Candidatus Binatia bacterium]
MKSALAAFIFLTLARRFDRGQVSPPQVSAAIAYFPLVGIFLGLVLVLLNRLLDPHLESEILGVLLIAVLALLTGAIHYEGMQNTFDALSVKMGQGEKGRSLTFGLLAIVFVVLLKVRALEVTGETRSLGLLLTPLFARWSLVIFLYGSASFAEGTARILADNVRAWHLALTTILTLALAAFLVGRIALWIGLYLSLLVLLSRTYLRRRNGCIGSDNFGAVVELSETLSFVLFASL